jgi:hypothetical protein
MLRIMTRVSFIENAIHHCRQLNERNVKTARGKLDRQEGE